MGDEPPDEEERLAALAASLLEDEKIDWDALDRRATSDEERRLLANLRTVTQIAALATEPAPSDSRPTGVGSVWGPLPILGTLGWGGFGHVYRAWDSGLEREVALKLLNRRPPSEGQAALEEGRLLARIRHPNVVTVHGADCFDGHVGIWMELVHGKTLAQILEAQGVFGPREACLVGLDLCRALAAVHAAGLAHGDVKAQNVMREEGGRIVLMDFGVGRRLVAPPEARLVGTPHYMAPEVIAGEPAAVAADVYALGVLLFHLVTGSYPVAADGTRTLVRDTRPDLPEVFVQTVERALAPSPSQRYATAGAFEAALSAWLGAGSLATSTPATGDVRPIEPADRLEYLEHAAEDLGRLCREARHDDDRVLDRLSDFVTEGTLLVEQLSTLFAAQPRHAEGHALALSLRHLTEGVLADLRAHGFDTLLEGYLFHLEKAVGRPLKSLLEFVGEGAVGQAIDDDFFAWEADLRSETDLDALIEDLLSEEELKRHDALLALGGRHAEAFAERLPVWPDVTRERVLAIVWERADLLLLEGRGRCRGIVEAACAAASDPGLRGRLELLKELFFATDDESAIRRALQQVSAQAAEDRRVFGRAFLFHPRETVRKLALEILQPADYWEVITQPGTPIPWLLEIWRCLKDRVVPTFQKVFFACVRDRMVRPGGAERVVPLVDLVKEFYQVDVFHEDTFFRMLVELDERVRVEGQRHGLLVDLDVGYVRIVREFLSKGSRRDQPIEGWAAVPLPIQRRVARLGYFMKHFVCHPKDPIALECLAHLRLLGDVTEYVQIPAINSRLLGDLAKERHLFRREEARYALVSNPKTPVHVIRHHIRLLRGDSLRKLAQNRHGNQFARTLAQNMLRFAAGR